MKLIGENIHIISKSVQNALITRDKKTIISLIDAQKDMDFADLNAGPAKGKYEGVLSWLTELVQEKNPNIGISLDTTNADEITNALKICKKPQNTFLNSTSKDEPRLDKFTTLASENGCNLIALTLSKETGIPKTADGRLEIAFEIYEKCAEKGIENDKIYFDPLILPICVEQSQAVEALNTIKMVKESFDPSVNTVIGLSNISNGCPSELRPLINRVFAVLAFGAGLDAAIIDAKDAELTRILRMLEKACPQNEIDKLYTDIAAMIANFGEIEDINYNARDEQQAKIIKAVNILLGKKIYSHSFTQI